MKKLLIIILALALLTAPAFPARAEDDAVEMFNKAAEAWNDGDYESAIPYLIALTHMGEIQSMYNLGIAYANGLGVEQSYEQAAEYFQMAADCGHTDSQYIIGMMYYDGSGVAQSYEQAVHYLEMAAEQGSADAQYWLGAMYEDGCGVEQDCARAAEYYRLAVSQGHVHAQYNLGRLYRDGRGVEQDYEQAAAYFLLAAEQGDVDGQLSLGVAYANGRGVEQDYEQAVAYFRLAAEQGDADALNNLGISYETGQGVEQDYAQAAEYYRQAADQGQASAQRHLGHLYKEGLGVEQDYAQAEAYLRLAADQGDAEAQRLLEEVEAILAANDAADSAEAAVEALRKQAVNAGMTLPEPGEGEKLYLGVGDVPDTQQSKLFLAFILSPNGRSVRNLTLYGQALEVPVEGADPWLIDSQISTIDDYWFALEDYPTDIPLREEPPIGLAGLTLDGDAATCRMTYSGNYQKPEKGVDGDWSATADIALVNLSGDACMDAIDPPTPEEVKAAGMPLPEPGAGEALYLGAANVSQAKALYAAFVLSEDGDSIHDLIVYVQNMEIEYRHDGTSTHLTSSSGSSRIFSSQPVAADINIGNIRFSEFAVDGDTATAVLHYVYRVDQDDYDYPLDAARVAFAKVE